MNYRFLLTLVVLWCCFGTVVFAQEPGPNGLSRARLDSDLERAASLEKQFAELRARDAGKTALERLRVEANDLRKTARGCIDRQQALLDRIATDLQQIGEAVEGEDAAVRLGRERLDKEKAERDQLISSCRLLLVNSEKLLDELEIEITGAERRQLMARFPGVIAVLTATPEELSGMRELVRHHEREMAFPRLDGTWRILLAVFVVAALGSIPWAGRVFRRQGPMPPGEDEFTRSMTFAFRQAIVGYGGWLIAAGLFTTFWLLVAWRQDVLVPELGMSLCAMAFLALLIAGRTFLSPRAPATHYLPFEETGSRRFWVAVRFLGLVWASAAFLYFAVFIKWPLSVALHLRFAFTALFAISLGRVVWLFFELSPRRGFRLLQVLVILVLGCAVVAEFVGYRNFSSFLIGGVLVSVATLALAWLAARLIDDFLASIEEGRYAWERDFHQWIGVPEGGYLPGIFWFRLLMTVSVWLLALWAFVGIWGVPEAVRNDAVTYVTEGFSVGDVTIVPGRIFSALALMAILFAAISWLRKQLDEKWLRKSRADVGARNAVSSISAYVGVTIALLIALSVAGVDLKNVAIIAGALSVGIGFGLQNVVNNFVSGLILLFERPIRQGDWVVVGTTEGYVKRISVRSTQIQTFDNADVIVPNSDLISNQVTNWMLRDRRGRVRIPVGVAYGTDVQRVKEVLLSIAMEHPQTVVDGTNPRPRALFMAFGASSLDFELRFFIHNIDERLNVLSDVNFSIDKAFREAGIAIPFPQTDVHLHYLPTGKEGGDTGISESDDIDSDHVQESNEDSQSGSSVDGPAP